MFELVTGNARHTPRHPAIPVLVSTAAHVVVVGLVIAVPLLYVTEQMPEMPSMMAFVAPPPATPPAPPPPPPPPAPAAAPKATPAAHAAPTSAAAAPLEAPSRTEPEPVTVVGDGEEGVLGGVEGGVPGGVLGGIVGGIPEEPPPPPPPPVAPRAPVRVGGQIEPPALIYRVEPLYPSFAVQAHIQGTVILEAIVNEEGAVDSVRVLRSVGVLDRAAMEAVKQWRYSPLLLNGRRERFILTVMLSFSLSDARR